MRPTRIRDLIMKHQSNSVSVMDTGIRIQNEDSPKNRMSRRNVFILFCFALLTGSFLFSGCSEMDSSSGNIEVPEQDMEQAACEDEGEVALGGFNPYITRAIPGSRLSITKYGGFTGPTSNTAQSLYTGEI